MTGSVEGRLRSVRDLEVEVQRVFLRLDLNVPLKKEGDTLVVADDNRIQQALPTIQHLIERNARVIIGSHFGRPKDREPEFSLEPVCNELAKRLDCEVTLTDQCTGEGIEMMSQNLKPGEVMVLENLRFDPGEKKNDPEFSQALSRLADVYVTDAFGTAHRKHASTYGLPSLVAEKGVGFLIEKEIQYLKPLMNQPKEPFMAILGGSKVSDKIKTLENLLRDVDAFIIGGAMVYAFWAAQGQTVPPEAKQPTDDDIEAAKKILRLAQKNEINMVLASDTIDTKDVGPESVERFKQVLSRAKTVFWNGPLGLFEDPAYAGGTKAIAETLSTLDAVKVVGGGDTVAAIRSFGLESGFDHLSTGGGAVLTYLEGAGLPGIDVLKDRPRKSERL